jgi:putative oxidoreductase
MRIVVGFLFACHGAQKLFGVLGGINQRGASAPLLSLFGLAGIIEFVGGLLIAVGLFAGYAAFIASGEMAWAFFTAHFPAASGRSRTAASWRCSSASCSCTSPAEEPAYGASTGR